MQHETPLMSNRILTAWTAEKHEEGILGRGCYLIKRRVLPRLFIKRALLTEKVTSSHTDGPQRC